jgi:nitrite reductase (cytochrome c-552)
MKKKLFYFFVAILAAAVTVAVLLLRENIAQRKLEAQHRIFRVVEITEETTDPAEWGKNFPRQYDSYKRTVDMERTRYGGSEAEPATIVVERGQTPKTISKLEKDPRLVTIWAGFAFAIDYREERGHAYMLHDQRETERVRQRPQPGACLHCHSSTTVAYRKVGLQRGAPGRLSDPLLSPAGLEQLMKGFEAVCAMPFSNAVQLVEHPVSCIDCHDPKTMQLRITRPAFMEGVAALAASNDPVPHLPSIERWRAGSRARPYDANREASRQEMRSLVCAQCHVEYYFKGDEKRLVFPWHNGLKAEQMLAYYDQPMFKDGKPFADWKHKRTGADVIKVQHPEFELWSQGIHARAGVACADCHMPYLREGAMKISSHHVRSPLLNVAASCQVCHRASEEELKQRAFTIQDRTKQLIDRALDALVALIQDIEAAQKAGATDAQLAEARRLQRQAQFRVDFIDAENSMGFHAPQEAARILAEAIDYAQQGRLAVARIHPVQQASTEVR